MGMSGTNGFKRGDERMTRRDASNIYVGCLVLGLSTPFCDISGRAQTQQPNATSFNQTYEVAKAKARDECKTLWSDRAFDPLRSKIPLDEEKPAFSMLTNREKLRPKDKPLADLAIKTLEKCRAAYAPVYAMLPAQAKALIEGVWQNQDALIAELYNGKITFGEYNVSMNRLYGELSETLSGIPIGPKPTTVARAADKISTATPKPAPTTRAAETASVQAGSQPPTSPIPVFNER